VTGSSVLTEDISEGTTEIPVLSDQYFKDLQLSTLHAVKIGDEIIRFRAVSAQAPYKLLECQRGMYGTKASVHPKGTVAGMLFDYPYNTLFPNVELQQEIAGNLSRFFNETGVSHLDFDGHEGCLSAGEGDYGMQIFADKVLKDTKHTLVNGTSRSYHYYWHLCHYWNWGEPWYGGFRESQGDYRMDDGSCCGIQCRFCFGSTVQKPSEKSEYGSVACFGQTLAGGLPIKNFLCRSNCPVKESGE
jgi:hypothetical protein